MDLYTFGLPLHPTSDTSSTSPQTPSKTPLLTPTKTHTSPYLIKILCTSWCDALILSSTSPTSPPQIHYTSTSPCLSTSQQHLISTISNLPLPTINKLTYFANPLGRGLEGLYIPSPSTTPESAIGKTILFNTPHEQKGQNIPETEVHKPPLKPGEVIKTTAITSGGRVAVYIAPSPTSSSYTARILEFKNETDFKSWIRGQNQNQHRLIHTTHSTIYTPNPILAATSLSFTLHQFSSLQTWTPDPRYPQLIGRPITSTPATSPHPIPYLSETSISKIVTGSWLSAALSREGELFLWGIGTLADSAGGGGEEVFDFLKKGEEGDGEDDLSGDEFVRIKEFGIEGREARVTAVGIGIAHVVVATETEEGDGGEKQRAVFAAGRGDQGQLGVGERVKFCGEFREVVGLRGRVVRDIRCAGWTSWVVVDSEVVDLNG